MRRREGGFTLIELAASLGLFAIAMVSLSLLFDRAVSATGRARFDQVAKTLAQEKLEEVRSLPYFVPQREEPGDVDLLDRYFLDADASQDVTPTGATGTYDGTTGVWSYTSAETLDMATGPDVTRTVVLQFVQVTPDGQIVVRAPAAGYDSDDPALDQPPADSVRVGVTTEWLFSTGPRSVELDTIMTGFRQGEPSVEASGSSIGALVSGVTFQDGDVGGVAADLQATVAEASVAFRETTTPTAQARADSVDVVERDPETNVSIQAELPTDGESSATAPNSTTGTSQSTSASVLAGTMVTVDLPTSTIAVWGPADPAAATEARVSALHTQNPESRARATATEFLLHARDLLQLTPNRTIELANVTGVVEQSSTTTQSTVTSTVDITPTLVLPGAVVWAAPQFEDNPAFQGVVTIESMRVEVRSTAGATSSESFVDWEVRNLRVWDPDIVNGPLEPGGGYVGPYTFGFLSTCGGWVDDPDDCGPLRTDGKDDFENPNPVLIPQAYVGTDAQGNPATSLQIVAGVTVRDSSANAADGVSGATAAQKNILTISTRDDIGGAAALEPMLVGLGDANTSVSYVSHEH